MFVFSDTIGSTSVPVCADTTDTRYGNEGDTRHAQSTQDDEAVHSDTTYVVDRPLVARQPCTGSTGLTEPGSRPGESGDWLTSDKTAPAKRLCAAREIDAVTAMEPERCTQGRIYKMKVPPPSSVLTTNSEPLMVSSGTSSGGPTTSSPINSQSLVVCPATSSPVNSQPLMVSSGTSSGGPTSSGTSSGGPTSSGTSSGHTTTSIADRFVIYIVSLYIYYIATLYMNFVTSSHRFTFICNCCLVLLL